MDDIGAVPDTRQKILDAAFELISIHGVRALTQVGVASQAGLSKGALLYHFKTKEDLISAMLRQAIATCMETPEGSRGWRFLVRGLLAAECMSPQVLEDNVPLFGDLLRSFVDSKGGDPSAVQATAAAIGAAFLDELGLLSVPF